MSSAPPALSNAFQSLYCDPALFASFSTLHPISFARVLPFQPTDPVADDHQLIYAEEAHLAHRSDDTRRRVLDAYLRCGILPQDDAASVSSVIDYFGADFFDLMGLVYANARMFRCALRWYRESIRELEANNPDSASDTESVYASVGYSLYSLGLFEETIAWSKSCIGPRMLADTVSRVLIDYEARLDGGAIKGIERSGPRMRYTVVTFDPEHSIQNIPRLKTAMTEFAPFQEVYMDWVKTDEPAPELSPTEYPFQPELDGGPLVRHKMNLIFATCGHADALVARGYILEAKRVLNEAAMIEPQAACIQERLKFLS
jgi:hypothetical protein